jgi:hypothetical protein
MKESAMSVSVEPKVSTTAGSFGGDSGIRGFGLVSVARLAFGGMAAVSSLLPRRRPIDKDEFLKRQLDQAEWEKAMKEARIRLDLSILDCPLDPIDRSLY